MPEKTTIVINCTLLTDPAAKLAPASYITIARNRIQACGPMDNSPDPAPFDTVIDAGGSLVMPGLVNSHNHCAMTLFRGLADDLELSDWLQNNIFPAEAAHVNPEMVYWCTKLAAAEMLLAGTTTVADGYFFSDHAARALDDAGMRAVVAHGIVDFPAPSVPDPSKNIDAVKNFIDNWQNRSPRVSPAVFAHAPYTCSPETITRAKSLADGSGVRFFTHIAESRQELSMIIDPRSDSPVRHLDALGVLNANTACVHCVWIDDRDMDILAKSGTGIITCPQSNLKLASGIAPVAEMTGRSIPIGLGTDGCASNNSLDMFREMGMLARLQKSVTRNPTAMPARQVLSFATSEGAKVIGVDGCGTLVPGSRADLIIMSPDSVNLVPLYNQDLLVYSASGHDVEWVMVDGSLVVGKRKICSFDLDETLHEVRKIAAQL